MKNINRFFAFAVGLILLGCLAVSIFFPKEINEYENRYMEHYEKLNASSFLSGNFQDQAELALGDQLPLAISIKKTYNNAVSAVSTKLLNKLVTALSSRVKAEEPDTAEEPENPEDDKEKAIFDDLERGIYRGLRKPVVNDPASMYISFSSGMRLYKDHLMYGFTQLDWVTEDLKLWADSANTLISEYPDIKFYTYYIEKENELDFVTGERNGLFDYLYNLINLPAEDKRGFFVDSFEDFDSWFYKTDHHWSAYGSYRGYTQVLDMLLPDEKPLKAKGYIELGPMSGSKANSQETQNYSETMGVLEMDFAPVELRINGSAAGSYGAQISYVRKAKEGTLDVPKFTYGMVYGQDNGEIIITNQSKDTGNILLIGESFDNALLMPLSQHFSEIYSIDLRNYKAQVGKDFDFDSYVKEHNIERVLFIGNVDYFIMSDFRLR